MTTCKKHEIYTDTLSVLELCCICDSTGDNSRRLSKWLYQTAKKTICFEGNLLRCVVFCFACLCLVYPMLPVSLDRLFLTPP